MSMIDSSVIKLFSVQIRGKKLCQIGITPRLLFKNLGGFRTEIGRQQHATIDR